jgi:hypothetical protein
MVLLEYPELLGKDPVKTNGFDDSSFITPFLLLYYKSKIIGLHQNCVRAIFYLPKTHMNLIETNLE